MSCQSQLFSLLTCTDALRKDFTICWANVRRILLFDLPVTLPKFLNSLCQCFPCQVSFLAVSQLLHPVMERFRPSLNARVKLRKGQSEVAVSLSAVSYQNRQTTVTEDDRVRVVLCQTAFVHLTYFFFFTSRASTVLVMQSRICLWTREQTSK